MLPGHPHTLCKAGTLRGVHKVCPPLNTGNESPRRPGFRDATDQRRSQRGSPPVAARRRAGGHDGRGESGSRWPFRSAHERVPMHCRKGKPVEASRRFGLPDLRLGRAPQVNVVYLMERSWADTLQISREHFAIEYAGSQFFLVDRGSAYGTIVAGTHVGGERTGGRTESRSGDKIIVGTGTSPYLFRFETVSDGQRYPAC